MNWLQILRNRTRLARPDSTRGNRDLYIHHHLGLGDMIHCNGMVRHLLESQAKDDCVQVFCKQRNLEMVQWMYRDEPRIRLLPIDENRNESRQVHNILRRARAEHFLSVGHKRLRHFEAQHPHLFFDQLFYLQLAIPYEFRFSKCRWDREMDEEERVFKKLAPPGDYAFVHDDASRGYNICTDAINLPVVRNDISESIFHLGLLLERAREVHCMESSIRCLIESLEMSNVDLFLHTFRYAHRSLGTATCQRWETITRTLAAVEK